MIFPPPAFPQPATSSSDHTDPPTLTNVAQIFKLSPEQAQANPKIQIQGVVTSYDPGNVLFVQDDTAGVFVHYSGERLPLAPGQHVRVSGLATTGLYSPIIISPDIQPAGPGSSIRPRPVSLAQVQYGGLDAQWVEVSGVVRAQKVSNDRLTLTLADPPHRIQVWISAAGDSENLQLVGNLVKIRGVVGAGFGPQKQLKGFQIYANAVSDLTILRRPAGDPFAAPACLIRDLKTYLARNGVPGLVRVRGVVTLSQPGRGIFIQDSTGGLEVQSPSVLDDLKPGTMVEVVGYPGPILEQTLLEDALIRKLEATAPPPPVPALSKDLFQGRYNNQLIEVKGLYLGRVNMPSNVIALAVQTGDQHLTALLETARLPNTLTDLMPGCSVRLTGICRSQSNLGNESATFLLLRSPLDVRIVRTPFSIQTVGLPGLVTGAILVCIGLAVAWWFIQKQRRETDHVLQLHAVLQTEMQQSEQQLRRSMEERERIGRDLHDDIIQSIYAAGLGLEDCRRVVHQSPEQAEKRLAAAIHTLNNTIRGVRGFIAGLEPKVLNGHEFKTALKSLALTSGDGPTPFQFQVDSAAANSLTSTQATQLLHIAKEGMSNSLRHAQASKVTVSLQPVSNGIRLEISDDGVGFDPGGGGGTGQGIRNMAARAREIGGDLETLSAPGQGCRILVTVPQGNPQI